jgi:hypothetical protein
MGPWVRLFRPRLKALLSTRTEADFQAWRDARDWHARKHAMWAAGELLPSQKPVVSQFEFLNVVGSQ